MSVFQITIFFLYIIAGLLFGLTRLQSDSAQRKMLLAVAFITGATGVLWHAWTLSLLILGGGGMSLSIGNTASFIGLQIALIALLGALESSLRGLSGGLLILAGLVAVLTGGESTAVAGTPSLQLQTHILISLFAYGLLTVGAIVAIFALIQDHLRFHFASQN